MILHEFGEPKQFNKWSFLYFNVMFITITMRQRAPPENEADRNCRTNFQWILLKICFVIFEGILAVWIKWPLIELKHFTVVESEKSEQNTFPIKWKSSQRPVSCPTLEKYNDSLKTTEPIQGQVLLWVAVGFNYHCVLVNKNECF